VIVPVLTLLLVNQLLYDPPYLARIKKGLVNLNFDYVGFLLLAVGVRLASNPARQRTGRRLVPPP
jgi:hypothetical protein